MHNLRCMCIMCAQCAVCSARNNVLPLPFFIFLFRFFSSFLFYCLFHPLHTQIERTAELSNCLMRFAFPWIFFSVVFNDSRMRTLSSKCIFILITQMTDRWKMTSKIYNSLSLYRSSVFAVSIFLLSFFCRLSLSMLLCGAPNLYPGWLWFAIFFKMPAKKCMCARLSVIVHWNNLLVFTQKKILKLRVIGEHFCYNLCLKEKTSEFPLHFSRVQCSCYVSFFVISFLEA